MKTCICTSGRRGLKRKAKMHLFILNNIGSGTMDSTTSTENLVYSNAAELNTSPKKDKIYQMLKRLQLKNQPIRFIKMPKWMPRQNQRFIRILVAGTKERVKCLLYFRVVCFLKLISNS